MLNGRSLLSSPWLAVSALGDDGGDALLDASSGLEWEWEWERERERERELELKL
jgi:hypothetical protein